VRTSVMISNFSWAGRIDHDLDHVATMVDGAGFDSVFVADHLVQVEPGTEPSEPMLESLTTLAHLAAHTTRVRLGTMVASATLRPAAVLVKAVTTIDVLSHGRAWFGIGAGYQQAEADAMGVALPAVGDRFDALEDTLELARRMWSGDSTPFDGRQLHAGCPIGSPTPATSPHPPILIGGSGERRTLRLVARHADACNLPDVGDGGQFIRHKLAVLADHCATEGRPFEAIEKTVSTRLEPGEPASAFVARAAALAALGLDHLVVLTRGPWTAATLAVLAGAVPDLADIPTAAPGRRVRPDHQEHRP
jgi:alkanesulfonate monooxygenase SsuD/methylene tetrahydromethanopterin reductase-like flavin-dependent oxidoreductase (luciferase family)